MSYVSVYPPAHDTTYVKATTYLSIAYAPWLATDPLNSLIGSYIYNCWLTASAHTNQRFHIDLGSAKKVEQIYYENIHHSGASTDRGVKTFTFWGSNSSASFSDLVYGNDAGWTQLVCGQNTFDIHVNADQVDPKYINVTNSNTYRYYAFKFADNHGSSVYMALRRVELQEQEQEQIKFVDIKTEIAAEYLKGFYDLLTSIKSEYPILCQSIRVHYDHIPARDAQNVQRGQVMQFCIYRPDPLFSIDITTFKIRFNAGIWYEYGDARFTFTEISYREYMVYFNPPDLEYDSQIMIEVYCEDNANNLCVKLEIL